MLRVSVIICALSLAWPTRAQVALPEVKFQKDLQKAVTAGTRTSASRQFVIHETPASGLRPLDLDAAHASNYVRLDPAVLAVTCERVKDAFLAQFNSQDQWRGKISVFLHRARVLDEPVTIGAPAAGPDWAYYLDVPDSVDYTRLISAVVSVLLLENANRGSARPAELPAWLIQGMTRELIYSSTAPLVVNEPQRRTDAINSSAMFMQGNPRAALSRTREELRVHAPLTLDELSWPRNGDDESGAFRASAQLLVHELMAFEDGPRCMAAFMGGLAKHLNWQTAFYSAFQNHFSSPLDLEKWWALKIVSFTGRDLTRTLSSAESWRKLDATLRTTVQVRSSADEVPLSGEVSLQIAIRDWNTVMQAELIREKLKQLDLLRASTTRNIGTAYEDYQLRNNARPLQVSQDIIFLVDDYRQVLDAYYKKRDDAGFLKKSRLEIKPGLDKDAREAIRQLDMLDGVRRELRPTGEPVVTVNNPNY